MEIVAYKHIGKNTLEGTFDLKIPKWGNIIIYGLSYFNKNGNKWISFPARKYEKDGQTKYLPYLRFESQEVMTKFQDAVLKILQEYLVKNPPQIQNNQMSFPGFSEVAPSFSEPIPGSIPF